MPIKPKTDESKDDFISRCVAKEIDSGKEKEQAVAICYSLWENKNLQEEKNVLKIYQKMIKKIKE